MDCEIRHLLSHTNGIDADLYMPDVNGPDSLRVAVPRPDHRTDRGRRPDPLRGHLPLQPDARGRRRIGGTATYERADDTQRRVFTAFAGGSIPTMTRRFIPVGKDLFAPAGQPLDTFTGYSRQHLVSYHDIRDGKAHFRSAGGRMTRRSEH